MAAAFARMQVINSPARKHLAILALVDALVAEQPFTSRAMPRTHITHTVLAISAVFDAVVAQHGAALPACLGTVIAKTVLALWALVKMLLTHNTLAFKAFEQLTFAALVTALLAHRHFLTTKTSAVITFAALKIGIMCCTCSIATIFTVNNATAADKSVALRAIVHGIFTIVARLLAAPRTRAFLEKPSTFGGPKSAAVVAHDLVIALEVAAEQMRVFILDDGGGDEEQKFLNNAAGNEDSRFRQAERDAEHLLVPRMQQPRDANNLLKSDVCCRRSSSA
jgi:hypothetical protein